VRHDRPLEAEIAVTSAPNIQHPESLNDLVARITTVIGRETIPDRGRARSRSARASPT
jgi:K+-sensing histidine kinase KdpD